MFRLPDAKSVERNPSQERLRQMAVAVMPRLTKTEFENLNYQAKVTARLNNSTFFVSDREIGRLVDFWRMQEGPPTLQFDLEPEQGDSQGAAWDGEAGGGSRDEMLDKAVELASRYSHLSTSLL